MLCKGGWITEISTNFNLFYVTWILLMIIYVICKTTILKKMIFGTQFIDKSNIRSSRKIVYQLQLTMKRLRFLTFSEYKFILSLLLGCFKYETKFGSEVYLEYLRLHEIDSFLRPRKSIPLQIFAIQLVALFNTFSICWNNGIHLTARNSRHAVVLHKVRNKLEVLNGPLVYYVVVPAIVTNARMYICICVYI